MQIAVENKNGIAVIKISGKIIFDETLFELREHVQELLQSGSRRFLIDLTDVPHIDSSGCGEVIRIYSSIVKANGVIAFANLAERVVVLWTRIKLTEVFKIFQTVDEAHTFLES